MGMWEPFTEPARRTIIAAQEVAQEHGSTFIDHNHIFVALAGTKTIGQILQPLGVGSKEIAAVSERVLGPKSASGTQELVFSPASKRLIELAFENARELDNHFIDAEHLMLGYLSLGDADKVMIRELRLNEEQLRRGLIESLEPKPKGPPPAKTPAPTAVEFSRIYDRVAHIAKPQSPAELWNRLQSAAEQKDLDSVLVYALSVAWHDGASREDILRRIASRLRELSGD